MSALAIVVLSLAYALPGLLAVRPIAGHFAWSMKGQWRNAPNPDIWFFATIVSLLVSCVWPLAGLWMLAEKFSPKIGAEKAPALKASQEKRQRELDRQEREQRAEAARLENLYRELVELPNAEDVSKVMSRR